MSTGRWLAGRIDQVRARLGSVEQRIQARGVTAQDLSDFLRLQGHLDGLESAARHLGAEAGFDQNLEELARVIVYSDDAYQWRMELAHLLQQAGHDMAANRIRTLAHGYEFWSTAEK